MRFNIRDVFLGVAAFFAILHIISIPTGYAAAIATPEGYFDWFRENSSVWLGVKLFDLVTVFPAMAIPVFILMYSSTRFFAKSWVIYALATIVFIYAHHFWIIFELIASYPPIYEAHGLSIFWPPIAMPFVILVSAYWANRHIKNEADSVVAQSTAS